jgi:hypothetical protein
MKKLFRRGLQYISPHARILFVMCKTSILTDAAVHLDLGQVLEKGWTGAKRKALDHRASPICAQEGSFRGMAAGWD